MYARPNSFITAIPQKSGFGANDSTLREDKEANRQAALIGGLSDVRYPPTETKFRRAAK